MDRTRAWAIVSFCVSTLSLGHLEILCYYLRAATFLAHQGAGVAGGRAGLLDVDGVDLDCEGVSPW